MRKSITVELQREGKKEPYIEHFENVPFVENNSVYLFPGDNFGVDLTVADRKVVVAYDPRPKKADLEFSLVQQTASNTKRPFMILHVENRLARIVGFSVVMKLPEQKKEKETNRDQDPKGRKQDFLLAGRRSEDDSGRLSVLVEKDGSRRSSVVSRWLVGKGYTSVVPTLSRRHAKGWGTPLWG